MSNLNTALRLSVFVTNTLLVYPWTALAQEPNQGTIIIQPGPEQGKDAWIQRNAPDGNHGADGSLALRGPDGVWDEKNAVLEFQIPIYMKSVKLFLYRHGMQQNTTVAVYKVISTWAESTVTWNNQPSVDPTPSASFAVDTIDGWNSVDLTSVTSPGDTLSIELRLGNHWGSFYSSDYMGDPSLRPKLEVTYALSEYTAFRLIDGNRVQVGLSFPLSQQEAIVDTLPQGVSLVPNSIAAFDSTADSITPTFNLDGQILTISGEGITVVQYEVDPPTQLITGDVWSGDAPIIEIEQAPSRLGLLVRLWEKAATRRAAQKDNAVAAFIGALGPQDMQAAPVVTLENDTVYSFTNAALVGGDKGILQQGLPTGAYSVQANTANNEAEAEIHLAMFGFASVQPWSLVGTYFVVRGTNFENTLEEEQAYLTVTSDYYGYLGAHAGGSAGIRIRILVKEWPISNLNFVGSSVGEHIVLDESRAAAELRETFSGTDPWAPAQPFRLLEDHLYLVELQVEADAGQYSAGNAIVDFGDVIVNESGDRGAHLVPTSSTPVIGIDFVDPAQVDLYVRDKDLTVTPPEPIEGSPASISVPVYNIGTADATRVTVGFTDNGQVMPMFTGLTIPAGGSIVLATAWNTVGGYATNPHVIQVTTDPSNTIAEKVETNNSASDTVYVKQAPTDAQAIVLDKSGSMNGKVAGIKKTELTKTAAHLLVSGKLAAGPDGPGEATSVYNFDHRIERTQPLIFADGDPLYPATGTGKDLLHKAIDDSDPSGGATDLWGAIWQAIDEVKEVMAVRSVVIFTDGGDNTNSYTSDQVLIKATTNATALIITTPQAIVEDWLSDPPGMLRFLIRSRLENLAQNTGGGFYVLPPDGAGIANIIEAITASLSEGEEGTINSPIDRPWAGIGRRGQLAGAINITDPTGTFLEGGVLSIYLPDGVSFSSMPEVTANNLELGASDVSAAGHVLTIPITAPPTPGSFAFVTIARILYDLEDWVTPGDIRVEILGANGTIPLGSPITNAVAVTVPSLNPGVDATWILPKSGFVDFQTDTLTSGVHWLTGGSHKEFDSQPGIFVYDANDTLVASETKDNFLVFTASGDQQYRIKVSNPSEFNPMWLELDLDRQETMPGLTIPDSLSDQVLDPGTNPFEAYALSLDTLHRYTIEASSDIGHTFLHLFSATSGSAEALSDDSARITDFVPASSGWYVLMVQTVGPVTNFDLALQSTPITSVETRTVASGSFAISENYPNPFNLSTVIHYQLAERATVTLKIYNFLGQEIRTLLNAKKDAGYDVVSWDAKDCWNNPVANGVYIYSFLIQPVSAQSRSYVKSGKLVLLR